MSERKISPFSIAYVMQVSWKGVSYESYAALSVAARTLILHHKICRKGTVFHESRGKHYFDGSFGEGDVLGIMIDLPEKNPVSQFPPTYKDKVT